MGTENQKTTLDNTEKATWTQHQKIVIKSQKNKRGEEEKSACKKQVQNKMVIGTYISYVC